MGYSLGYSCLLFWATWLSRWGVGFRGEGLGFQLPSGLFYSPGWAVLVVCLRCQLGLGFRLGFVESWAFGSRPAVLKVVGSCLRDLGIWPNGDASRRRAEGPVAGAFFNMPSVGPVERSNMKSTHTTLQICLCNGTPVGLVI